MKTKFIVATEYPKYLMKRVFKEKGIALVDKSEAAVGKIIPGAATWIFGTSLKEGEFCANPYTVFNDDVLLEYFEHIADTCIGKDFYVRIWPEIFFEDVNENDRNNRASYNSDDDTTLFENCPIRLRLKIRTRGFVEAPEEI